MSLPAMAANVAALPCATHAPKENGVDAMPISSLSPLANAAKTMSTPSLWMGVLDRIIDWFRGSPRRNHLKALCKQMCGEEVEGKQQPDARSGAFAERQHDAQRVQAFCALKGMAKLAYQDRFKMSMENTQDGLQYVLKIDGTDFEYKNTARAPLQTCIDFNRIASTARFGNADGIKLQGQLLGIQIEHALRSTRDDLAEQQLGESIQHLKRCIDDASAKLLPNEDPVEVFARQLGAVCQHKGDLPMSVDLDLYGKTDYVKCRALLTTMGPRTDGDVSMAAKPRVVLYEAGLTSNLPTLIKHSFRMRLRNEHDAHAQRWQCRDDLIEMNLETVAPHATTRAFVRKNLANGHFSRVNLTGVADEGSTFWVQFRQKDWVVLCNRSSTNGEFRGERLQKALEYNFKSLGDLLGRDFLTANDPRLRVSMSKLYADIDAMKALLSQEERVAIVQDLAPIVLVRRDADRTTTLGEVLGQKFNDFIAAETHRHPIRASA